MKFKIKHDLKKYPDLTLNDTNEPKRKMSTGFKLIIGIIVAIIIFYIVLLADFAKN